jgi:hypothetical protein
MGPNQIIQDNIIKNCAEGLKDALWLVWRTLIQYGDDYGVKRLAQQFNTDDQPIFLDAQAFDDMNFGERKTIHIDLALGMASEQNSLQRLQIVKQVQQQMAAEVTAGVSSGALTPDAFKKLRRPYEDMLNVLGIKQCEAYLPSEEEVMAMIKQAQEAAKSKQPGPDEIKAKAQAELDNAKTQEIMSKMAGTHPDATRALAQANKENADVSGTSAGKQLDAIALIKQHKATNY